MGWRRNEIFQTECGIGLKAGRSFIVSFRRWLISRLWKKEFGLTEKEWRHVRFSFSQFGEDLVVEQLLPAHGFYIDIGAFHPVYFSNTYGLYRLKGWRGLLAEPSPKFASLLRQRRPRDQIVEVALGPREGRVSFLESDKEGVGEGAGNGVVDGGVNPLFPQQDRSGKILEVRMTTLRTFLDENLPAGQSVDFLSLDAEGMDLEILQTNDWARVHPQVICVEALTPSDEAGLRSYLAPKGYRFLGRIVYSLIFQKE